MLAEEFGMVGGLLLLGIYAIVLIYGFAIALRVHNQFGRLITLGSPEPSFSIVFINIAWSWTGPGRWCAVAVSVLWWNRDVIAHDWIWVHSLCLCTP